MSDTNPEQPASQLSRRAFLGTSAAVAGAAAMGGPVVRQARASDIAKPAAKNLVFVVADGMSMGTMQMGDLLVRRRTGKPSRWVELLGRSGVRQAIMDTQSADSIVTDSAAASTQWGTGKLANNGAIGLSPDGSLPEPILVRAARAGKATGLVTTCRITHATPAGFIANIQGNRDDEGPIAEQMLERRVDVLLGGGGTFVTPALLAGQQDAHIVRTRSELAATAVPGKRLIGIFSDKHMAFEVDREHSAPTQPSLADMTRAALARLGSASNGFVAQVEGGRVDHAAHSNDAAALIHDQAAFDEALGVVLDWADGRDDTLVIVTTDHGNANPAVTDYGPRGNAGFDALLKATRSFAWIEEQLSTKGGGSPSRDLVRQTVLEATGVALETRDLDVLERWMGGKNVDPTYLRDKGTSPLGSVLANHFAVAFLSANHTCDLVPVTAWGPASARLPGYLRMTEMHGVMTGALGI
jgi:alkaline phosphatase